MKPTASQIKASAKLYLKVVEWSEEDRCFIGSAPPLIGQCCHGQSEAVVLAQLQIIVEEWVTELLAHGKTLPAATANRSYSGKFVVRVTPEVHKKVALKALARGASLNQFVADALYQA